MAFEYGEAYYGLRTFGSSQGEVKDASASLTATCTIPNVNYVVAKGSGQITGTCASSTTCSGEVVIIEETDKYSYGMGAYGLQPYTQGDIQTIVYATSSATALCVRVIDAACSLTATASITANARRVPEGSALINGASTTTVTTSGNGSRVRTSGGTVSATATISQYCVRVRESSANPSATSSVTCNSVFMVNGAAALTGTATIAAICNRVRFGSGTPTANASITVLGFATRGGIASTGGTQHYTVTVQSVSGANKYFIHGVQQDVLNLVEGNTYVFNYPSSHPFRFSTTSNGTHASGSEYTTGVTHNSSIQTTIVVAVDAPNLYYYCASHSAMGGTANTPSNLVISTTVSDSERIQQPNVTIQPESLFTSACNRVQSTAGALSATSGTASIGREKWELIVNDNNTWTQIAA